MPRSATSLALVAITLVALCGVSLTSSPSGSSTCVFQAYQYTSLDSVLQCFYNVPFDPEVRSQTIDALKKAVELYAFLDIANNSPDPNLPMKVNILGGLDAISKRYVDQAIALTYYILLSVVANRWFGLTVGIISLCDKTIQVRL
jgi:hypothetical protein